MNKQTKLCDGIKEVEPLEGKREKEGERDEWENHTDK